MRLSRYLNVEITGQQLYLLGFTYFFTIAFLQTSMFLEFFGKNTLHDLSYLGLALILLKIFIFDKKSYIQYLATIIVLGILAITWRTSGEFTMLPMGILVLGAKDVDFKQIIRTYLIVGTLILMVTIVSSKIDIIRNLVYYRAGTSISRQSFGIIYPTDFAAHVLFLVMAYVYLKFKKANWKTYLGIIVVSLLVIKFCDARLSAYIMLLMVPVIWIGKQAAQGNKFCKFIANFSWSTPIIFGYVTVCLGYFFTISNPILKKIDQILSSRLYYEHVAIDKYGVSLFGRHMIEHAWGGLSGLRMTEKSPQSYFFIDSSYVRMLILYGLVVTLFVLVTMAILAWKSSEMGEYSLACIIVLLSIAAITEQHLYDPAYDPFLIALCAKGYFSKYKGEKKWLIVLKNWFKFFGKLSYLLRC